MTSRNKNIFAFATLTATAALGTALFAAGCGDSGDTTPAYPEANAVRTINLRLTDAKDALKAGKVDTLGCVITNKDGKRLYTAEEAKDRVQIKNVPAADKSDKSGKKIDTTNDIYATFQLTEDQFKAVRSEDATITAVYYNSQATSADKDKILGFSQDEISWYNADDEVTSENDKKSYGQVDSVSFFLDADDVNHILSVAPAAPDIIGKDKTTKLAYKVSKGNEGDKDYKQANIIGFVTVDGGKYLTKDDATIVGQYKGAEYTEAEGITLEATFNGGKLKSAAPVYVTDAKISGITVKQKYAGVLLPKKDAKVDYAFGLPEVKGSNGSKGLVTYGVGQTTMTAEITPDNWKVEKDKGVAPNRTITLEDKDVTYVANVGSKAAKVEEAKVEGAKINFLKVDDFTIVGTYKTDLAEKDGVVSGNITVTPVEPKVNVGFNTQDKVDAQTEAIAKFLGKDDKISKTTELKMYAQFAPTKEEAGAFTSVLFTPTTFTYPTLAKLYATPIAKDAEPFAEKVTGKEELKAEITGEQKEGNYTVTIRESVPELKVGFATSDKDTKYANDQQAAFGDYKDVNFNNDFVIVKE